MKKFMDKSQNKNSQLKVGVIGAGKMGLLHSGIFNNLEGSTLSAISEKKKIISEIIKQFVPDVAVYQNYEDMLEKEELDIVVITTPVFLHRKMILDAIDFNKHVFVEKPLALNGEECRSILKKPSNNERMVGYCRRFMETYNIAKKLIEGEKLGIVNFFNAHLFIAQVFNQGKGWLYNPDTSGGGVLMDLGSHAIDMLHYLFGDIKQVHAFGKSIYNKEVEDYVSVNIHFNDGFLGSLQVSWSIRNYRLPELYIEIHLDKGMIVVTEKYIKIYSEKDTHSIKKGWTSYYKQNLTKNIPIDLGGPEYTFEDLHFLNCIIKNEKPRSDFYQAAKTNLVIDRIYSSIQKDSVERINYEV